MKPDIDLLLGRALIAAAWSDGQLDASEREALEDLLLGLDGITPDTWRALHTDLERPFDPEHRERLFVELEAALTDQDSRERSGRQIARLIDNPHVNGYVTGIRERTGLTILDKRGVAARVDELLSGSQIVCFIADQDAGRKGYFVDFFGREASTYKSIGLMAAQHNVPVVVGFGRRLDTKSFRFELGIQRTILPAEWADRDDAPAWITQEYTRALEEVIRTAPEQYLWHYRRWRTRPRGEPAAPDGPEDR